jgi:uncharacterized membrane protein YedE/YeeE
MDAFFLPLLGGMIIGVSTLILLLHNGKVAGISTIFWNFCTSKSMESALFIIGLPLGALIAYSILGISQPTLPSNTSLILLAGFLVGFGVNRGSGCTSGHGVCGIGRLSIRSIVATLCFMASGIVTVALFGVNP